MIIRHSIDNAVPHVQVVLFLHETVDLLFRFCYRRGRGPSFAGAMLFGRLLCALLGLLGGFAGILGERRQIEHRLLGLRALLSLLQVDVKNLLGEAQILRRRHRVLSEFIRGHLSETLLLVVLVLGGDLGSTLGWFLGIFACSLSLGSGFTLCSFFTIGSFIS